MTMTVASFKTEYPAIAEALLAEGRNGANAEGIEKGRTEGIAKGAEAERARIRGVLDHRMAGHEELIDRLAFDGTTSPDAAAAQILKAEKAARVTTLGNLLEDGKVPARVKPSSSIEDRGAESDSHLSVEDRCKAKWDKDSNVRDEFIDLASYTAFEKAQAAGQIRILGKKSA